MSDVVARSAPDAAARFMTWKSQEVVEKVDAEKNTMIGFSALGLRLTPYLYAHKTHAETKNCFAYIVSRKSGGDGMSSVLIKGMRKPSGCAEFDGNKFIQCPFVNTDDDCILQNKCTGTWKDMYQNCQLVEISPHGRLIDADVPLEKVSKMMK